MRHRRKTKTITLFDQIILKFKLNALNSGGRGGGGGGVVAQRHDGVRNLLTSLIGKVCTSVEVEQQLQPLDNERFNLRRAVTSPEARLDMKVEGFWSRGVTALFDVWVTHVNSKDSLRSRRRRKSGSTNRGCWTLTWDLSLP